MKEKNSIGKQLPGWGRVACSTPQAFWIHAIKLDVLTIEAADHSKALLEQRKFVLKFASFRDVLLK